ncbi:MAG: MoaD/ThiS family protein [Chloroflexi bacterium]|nr:MoaD/ThiS family protein [Chloroflexota bacterium]
MATVFIPTMLQGLTGGVKQVEVEGNNMRRVIDGLEDLYPGIKDRLVEDGSIRPSLAVAIDGEVARMGLLEKVGENSEVHFVPAIGGGLCGNEPLSQKLQLAVGRPTAHICTENFARS